jgi:hypothetical protein
MTKIATKLAVAMATLFALAVVSLSPQSAEAQTRPLRNIAVTGLAGTNAFSGALTITSFALQDGILVANGVVRGVATGRRINQTFTNVPVELTSAAAAATPALVSAVLDPSEPFVCDILFLDLGPLNLNLLGLQLDLAEVVLDVDAIAGAGNLLGNLLCSVTGLLNILDLGALVQGILESLLGAINTLL